MQVKSVRQVLKVRKSGELSEEKPLKLKKRIRKSRKRFRRWRGRDMCERYPRRAVLRRKGRRLVILLIR